MRSYMVWWFLQCDRFHGHFFNQPLHMLGIGWQCAGLWPLAFPVGWPAATAGFVWPFWTISMAFMVIPTCFGYFCSATVFTATSFTYQDTGRRLADSGTVGATCYSCKPACSYCWCCMTLLDHFNGIGDHTWFGYICRATVFTATSFTFQDTHRKLTDSGTV